ncbi:penicillin-binding protein 1A [Luminiphilus sp. nBUS_07]|uniref:penicillin-binding protein 1A n=1 Tax=Luminiphilus sp. nBUS_07 TaxID=3395314 RepID=UPI003EB70167
MVLTRTLLVSFIIAGCAALWWLAGLYLYLSPNLPDADTLRDVKLQTPMRVMSSDGRLIGQFGEQKRSPLQFEEIPRDFINALLAAEDDQFFEHGGVDLLGLARAVSELIATGQKRSGGSTLTMQVARNYALSLEQTFLRKFNEILLALEVERVLTKAEIFELYVNRIFLGHRSYGFEAAAQTYYGKSLAELSLHQHAMLAGIPKAPSRNNPLSNPERAKIRRDWILGRMASLGMIDVETRDANRNQPVVAAYSGLRVEVEADYVAEIVRKEMLDRFGNGAYSDGYVVYTTVDGKAQIAARQALVNGLRTYDKRHGWRGPERQLPPLEGESLLELEDRWQQALNEMPIIVDLTPAIVTAVDATGATILSKLGDLHRLSWQGDLDSIRRYRTENLTSPAAKSIEDLLAVGDLIRMELDVEKQVARLAQVPRAQAALVALNPNDGAIRALVGGMGFELSKFNRATQARRQPGSNFKAFLYAAALEYGITPATLINDAPIVLDNLSSDEIWRPENDSGRFYGPTRLRNALTYSRNLVSIRVLQRLGLNRFIDYVGNLGFDTEGMARNLTLALGTHAYTPLDIAAGYAIVANGGFRVEPYLISRIEDATGRIIYQADPWVVCSSCDEELAESEEAFRMEDILQPVTEDIREAPQVMDPRASYLVSSMLRDVIKRGTGRRARVLERNDIAGKTGTTNGPRDAWFSGFNPNLVTTSWVGFDDYSLLGKREFGGTAALPIWIDFMREVLPEEQSLPDMPSGVVRLRIDRKTGRRVTGTPEGSSYEYFFEEFLPAQKSDSDQPVGTDELDGLF